MLAIDWAILTQGFNYSLVETKAKLCGRLIFRVQATLNGSENYHDVNFLISCKRLLEELHHLIENCVLG